mgnify:CR=1 FL=1
MHYEAARIARIMTIFEPVELVDDDLIYNGGGSGSGDADSVPDPDANQETIPSNLNRDDVTPIDTSQYGPFVRAIVYLQRLFGQPLQGQKPYEISNNRYENLNERHPVRQSKLYSQASLQNDRNSKVNPRIE